MALCVGGAWAQDQSGTIVAAPQPAVIEHHIPSADDREAWAAKLRDPGAGRNWRVPFQNGLDLTTLAPEAAYEILRENWPHVPGALERQNLLKAFFFQLPFPLTVRWHPYTLEAIDLAVYDADPEVRRWGYDYARYLSFRDFSDQQDAYAAWRESVARMPLREAVAKAAAEYVQRLPVMAGEEITSEVEWLSGNPVYRDSVDVRQAMRDAGMLDLAQVWIQDTGAPTPLRAGLLRIAGLMRADEAFLREVALPLTQRGHPMELRVAAVNALDGPHAAWAAPELARLLLGTLESRSESDLLVTPLASALGNIADPRTLPSLIAYMLAEPEPAPAYMVSYFALRPIARVDHDPSHDAAWWRAWWDDNRGNWGEDPAFASLPQATRQPRTGFEDPGRAADQRPTLDVRLDDDPMQRYLLIDPAASPDKPSAPPEDGYRLLVALPGGDGSVGHFDFVNGLARGNVPAGFLVAVAVAPQWSTNPDRVVWPLERSPDPAMKFTTEQFVRRIIDDVSARYPVNPAHVYALGWSSGGPPVYALLCEADSPLRGGFVAMSVFRPDWIDSVANAKGRSCFILHSSEDFIPINGAASAVESMRNAGVRATLRTYSGGHGWTEEAVARINIGVRWLMGEEVPDPPAPLSPTPPEAFR